jgi:chromosome segregation ATPase
LQIAPLKYSAATNGEASKSICAGGAQNNIQALSEVGSRVGEEDNEALHNLVIDTRRKLDELDDVKQAFDHVVLSLNDATRALDQEKILSKDLFNQLGKKASAYEKLRNDLCEVENKTHLFESEVENLRGALEHARKATRALEREHAEFADGISSRDVQIAELERQLEREAAQRCSLSKSNETTQEKLVRAEERVVELQELLAAANKKVLLFNEEKRAQRNSIEQALNETARLTGLLDDSESTLRDTRAELTDVKAIYAETCSERDHLAAALDELRDQHQAERQMLKDRLKVLQLRAATAEQVMVETRQRLIERALEARTFISKLAEATIARFKAERQLAEIDGSDWQRRYQIGDLENDRNALSEFLSALKVKSHELKLEGADQRHALLKE